MTSIGQPTVVTPTTNTVYVNPIPQTTVPAWAEVRFEKPGISVGAFTPASKYDLFDKARAIYGTPTSELISNGTITLSQTSETYTDPQTNAQTTYTWQTGGQDNGVTYHPDNLPANTNNSPFTYPITSQYNTSGSVVLSGTGNDIVHDGRISFTNTTGAVDLYFEMNNGTFEVGKYYAVDIVRDINNNYTLPTLPTFNLERIAIYGTLGAGGTSVFAPLSSSPVNTTVLEEGDVGYPDGHFGYYVSKYQNHWAVTPQASAKNYDRSLDPIPYHTASMPDNVYRIIFKCTHASNELTLFFVQNNGLVINAVNVVPLSDSAPDSNGQVTTVNSPLYMGNMYNWDESSVSSYKYHLLSPLHYYIKDNSININTFILSNIISRNQISTNAIDNYQTFIHQLRRNLNYIDDEIIFSPFLNLYQ